MRDSAKARFASRPAAACPADTVLPQDAVADLTAGGRRARAGAGVANVGLGTIEIATTVLAATVKSKSHG